MEHGSEFRIETIEYFIRVYEAEVIRALCEGNSYTSDLIQAKPTVSGTFSRQGDVNPDTNHPQVALKAAKGLSKQIAQVELEFSGRRLLQGGSEITTVTDLATGKTDGTVTIGNNVKIQGSKIKCVNANGTGLGYVSLICADGTAPPSSLAQNERTSLLFLIPAHFPPANIYYKSKPTTPTVLPC